MTEIITLYKRASVTSAGSSLDAWTTIGTVHAAVYFGSDREFAAGGATVAQKNIVFTVRRPAIKLDSGMRIVYSGETYDVTSVQPADQRGFLKLRASCLEFEGVGADA